VKRPDRRGLPLAKRRGFTLVEVLVGLMVGSVIVLGARLMLEGVGDGAQRVTRQAQRTDRDANAERVLRAVVAALETSESDGRTFGGNEREARFTSWCDTPGGWKELRAVTLTITSNGAASGKPGAGTLVLTMSGSTPLSIRAGFTYGALRYLADARDDGEWFTSWDVGISVPIAIGAIVDRDTLIFRIGVRG
jgi:prepilin-type N-terminal cleavage/methylation domain-containing protein